MSLYFSSGDHWWMTLGSSEKTRAAHFVLRIQRKKKKKALIICFTDAGVATTFFQRLQTT